MHQAGLRLPGRGARAAQAGGRGAGGEPRRRASHQSFRQAQRLDFTLLSDTDKSVAKRYGAFAEKTLYGRKVHGMIRTTFVIDDRSFVRRVFPRVRVEGHAAQVLKALEEL
jgi:peroxiredoxin Q/BCP